MLQSTLSSSHVLFFALHKASAILLMLGLLFFVVWVIKNVRKDKLKKLSLTLIALGVLGALLAGMLGGGAYYKGHKKDGSYKWDIIKKTELEASDSESGL